MKISKLRLSVVLLFTALLFGCGTLEYWGDISPFGVDTIGASEIGINRLDGANDVATATIGQQPYLFAAAYNDDAVNVLRVDSVGSLSFVDSVRDGERLANNLGGASNVETAVIGNQTYLFVAAFNDDAVSVFNVTSNGILNFVDDVEDGERSANNLDVPHDLETATIGNQTYLFVAARGDDAVSVFNVTSNGSLSFVDDVENGERGADNLGGASRVETAKIGNQTYLFVTAFRSVNVFSVASDGSLSFVNDIRDGEHGANNLLGAYDVETARIGGQTYLFVAADIDNAVSVFSVASNGILSFMDTVRDGVGSANNLAGADDLKTVEIGGQSYLFVAAWFDNTVNVFSVAQDGSLSLEGAIIDGENSANNLAGASSVETAIIGSQTYLFVAAFNDDALSAFNVTSNGRLSFTDALRDGESSTNDLAGASSVATTIIGNQTYLFVVAAIADDTVNVFSVASNGRLSLIDSVRDGVGRANNLAGANSVKTAIIDGQSYLFVAADEDNAVSVFSVAPDGSLTLVDSVRGGVGSANDLAGANNLEIAIIDGQTYLFVVADVDNAVSVFRVDPGAPGGILSFVGVTNNLAGVNDVATEIIGGQTYLFVAADNTVSVFSVDVASNNVLEHVDSVRDGAGRANDLAGVNSVETAIVSGQAYLFVAANIDDTVSVFRVTPDGRLSLVDSIRHRSRRYDNANTDFLDGANDVATAVVGGRTHLFVAARDDNAVNVFSVYRDGILSLIDIIPLFGAEDVETALIGGHTYLFVAADVGEQVVRVLRVSR